MLCNVEYFPHHFACNLDKKYPKLTLLELLPNINSCVFFLDETHLELFLYREVDVGLPNGACTIVLTYPLSQHTRLFTELGLKRNTRIFSNVIEP